MTSNLEQHTITQDSTFKDALNKLNQLAADAVLFVIDDGKLLGSLTDGDIRRGLLRGLTQKDTLLNFCNREPIVLLENNIEYSIVKECKKNDINIIPVINDARRLIRIYNLRKIKTILPVDVAIMAGGRGKRLNPFTNEIPKPLLPVGNKSIIQHNIDNLMKFGITDFWFSLRYLSELLQSSLDNTKPNDLNYHYIIEEKALGTIGAVSLIDDFKKDYILVMNSDVLTNIDFEAFYQDTIDKNADFSVVTIPYKIDLPYAIMDLNNEHVVGFQEKPTYTFNANAGIYLMKRSVLKEIPRDEFFDSTDLMNKLIEQKYHVSHFSHPGYWIDIGSHSDYKKAQEDIKTLSF